MSEFIFGNCLNILPTLPAQSVRLVFLDMPYGHTNLDFDKTVVGKGRKMDYTKPKDRQLMTDYITEILLPEFKRICLPNGVIVATSNKLFTGVLQNALCEYWVDEATWVKGNLTNPMQVGKNKQPSKVECINIFAFGKNYVFNPLQEEGAGKPYTGFKNELKSVGKVIGGAISKHRDNPTGKRYRGGVFCYSRDAKGFHDTQKPLPLLKDLITQYTNEGDFVLDPFAGSCTTGAACLRTNRNYICIESDANYYALAQARLQTEENKLLL